MDEKPKTFNWSKELMDAFQDGQPHVAIWSAEAQRTINELHDLLWLALKASDGEIVVMPYELASWGKPAGRIEWFTDPSSGIKIVRLVEDPS